MTSWRCIVPFLSALLVAVSAPPPAGAATFKRLTEKSAFLSLVRGRALTRLGVRLAVTPDGRIAGRAFGQPVTGSWDWSDGYFCRVLNFGSTHYAQNCQVVAISGDTLRFIADRGTGDTADLHLR